MRPGPKLEDSFRDENSQVFHGLQSLLINTSLVGLSISSLELNTLPHCTKYSFPPSTTPVSTSSAASRPTKVPTRLVG